MVKNGFVERVERELAPEHEFIERIFTMWDAECRGSLSFQVRRRTRAALVTVLKSSHRTSSPVSMACCIMI